MNPIEFSRLEDSPSPPGEGELSADGLVRRAIFPVQGLNEKLCSEGSRYALAVISDFWFARAMSCLNLAAQLGHIPCEKLAPE